MELPVGTLGARSAPVLTFGATPVRAADGAVSRDETKPEGGSAMARMCTALPMGMQMPCAGA
ncbi:hypothetical protein AFE02nite_11440 [Actinotalea fermentans]|uniref:Uncharacterized protein n=1 Tax=Actinotalea fermentans TaxID=43671 RepID=A0A511YW24_9CELL|nr:hypothetical protein AFE02nite_11440 [Actinotalea fermentans]